MYIKRLTVQNVGPHKKLDIEFKCGLVGIVGRNGCGKSTVVNLLYAVLTNDFGRFDGVKADCINNQSKPDDKAFAEVEAEHNGISFLVRRSLRPNKSVFFYTEDPASEITSSDKIAEELKKILGVDSGVLDRFVFKQQHLIYDFLSATDGERKKAFQKLCGTEHCETIWLALGRFVANNTSANQSITDNSDQLLTNITQLQTENEQYQVEIEKNKPFLLSSKTLLTIEAILNASVALKAAQTQSDDLQQKIATTTEKLSNAQEALTEEKDYENKIREKFNKYKEKIKTANDTKTAWLQYESIAAKKTAAVSKLNRVKEQLEELKKPDVVFDEVVCSELIKQRTEKQLKKTQLERVLRSFETTGLTECPTCLTPVTSLHEHIKTYRAEYDELIAWLKDADTTIQSMESAKLIVFDYEQKFRKLTAAHDAATQVADSIDVPAQPELSKEEALKVIAKYDEFEGMLKEAEAQTHIQETAVTRASSVLATCQNQFQEIQVKIRENSIVGSGSKTYTITDELVSSVKEKRAKHNQVFPEVTRWETLIEANNKSINRYEQDLENLRLMVKRNKKMKQLLELLEQVRDVVHRDRLPNLVAVANMERMEDGINDNLAKFGSPFWVETSQEDLAFIVHKPGEPPQPAGRLSTGQKVILAISFWLSLASVVGLLALDEPTANLDEDNRSFLADALSSLSTKISGHRQIIMVTHADNLRGCFDQIVTLG